MDGGGYSHATTTTRGHSGQGRTKIDKRFPRSSVGVTTAAAWHLVSPLPPFARGETKRLPPKLTKTPTAPAHRRQHDSPAAHPSPAPQQAEEDAGDEAGGLAVAVVVYRAHRCQANCLPDRVHVSAVLEDVDARLPAVRRLRRNGGETRLLSFVLYVPR